MREPLAEIERAEALKLARTADENPFGVDLGLLSPGFMLLARFALDAHERNEQLRGDCEVLAKLAAEELQFSSPPDVWRAKVIRDKYLRRETRQAHTHRRDDDAA